MRSRFLHAALEHLTVVEPGNECKTNNDKARIGDMYKQGKLLDLLQNTGLLPWPPPRCDSSSQ